MRSIGWGFARLWEMGVVCRIPKSGYMYAMYYSLPPTINVSPDPIIYHRIVFPPAGVHYLVGSFLTVFFSSKNGSIIWSARSVPTTLFGRAIFFGGGYVLFLVGGICPCKRKQTLASKKNYKCKHSLDLASPICLFCIPPPKHPVPRACLGCLWCSCPVSQKRFPKSWNLNRN